MPEEVEDCVDSVLEDNPDYSEDKAWAICQAQQKAEEEDISFSEAVAKLDDDELTVQKDRTKFKARMDRGIQAVFKAEGEEEDRFVIWGPASVEVVDKENDKIKADELEDALPQLLRRKRLSMEHSDQLVGDILESYETDEEVTVKFNGHEITRSEWPTDVLELDGMEPGLFVAGEVWSDTRQAEEAREKIEQGDINSYSISGEAITSSTKVKDGEIYDEITELDLSAVTLCEEGMNEKAKFGTVAKDESDDPATVNLGTASSRSVAIVKTNTHMSESNTEKSEEDGAERLELEDIRGELKEAASNALKEADFVTTEEVKSIVDSRLEQADIAEGDADSEGEEAEDDTETVVPDDPEEGDVEDDEEKQEEPEEEEELEEPEEPEDGEVDPDEIEDPDDDGEEELDLDPEEDEEMPPEEPEVEEDEEKAGYTVDELQEELPDDLYEAVSEYLTDEEVDPEPPEEEEEPLEMEDDEDEEDEEDEEEYDEMEAEKSGSSGAGGYVDKAVDETVVSSGVGLPAPEEEETTMSKGAEEVEEDDEMEKGSEPDPSTAASALIYNNDLSTQT